MNNNPFGLLAFLHWNHDWNDFSFPPALWDEAIAQIQDLGVSFVRLDILWSDVYAGKGKTNFSRYEPLISKLRDKNIYVLGLLHYNKVQNTEKGEKWSDPPQSFREFSSYVADTVSFFKHHIRHWEIWNEPNHPFYWSAPSDGLKKYCELLKLSYFAAKEANPESFVLNGGLAQPVVDAVKQLYAQGAKNFTDAISIHPFMDPFQKNIESYFDATIQGVYDIMKSYGDGSKKIWITEMGCPGLPNGHKTKWFAGEGPSEREQAKWLETQFNLAQRHPSIEKVFWAFYRDTKNMFHDATDFLGIVRHDLTPKPAYQAFKKLITNYAAL